MRRHLVGSIAAFAILGGCVAPNNTPDNTAICNAYTAQRSRVEIIGDGTIAGLLGTSTGIHGEHEGFLLKLSGSCDVLLRVETNVDFTGPIPLHANERVVVKGEFEYDPLGGVIHWTHRDPRGAHPGGFVEAGGRTYS